MKTKVDNNNNDNIKRFDLENDYTMTEKLWTVLVTSVLLRQCFVEVDAYSVHLLPSPNAKVEEGKTLTLNCSCNGFNNPDLINWYLNDDTTGLVIKARSCIYFITPRRYDINRYTISCHGTIFKLSIANISKGDHNDTWECDTTVSGMHPQHKASTKIMVMEYADRTTFPDIQNTQHELGLTTNQKESKDNLADQPDTSSKEFEKPAVEVMLIVVGVSLFTLAVIAGWLLYRKRQKDLYADDTKVDDIKDTQHELGLISNLKRKENCTDSVANRTNEDPVEDQEKTLMLGFA